MAALLRFAGAVTAQGSRFTTVSSMQSGATQLQVAFVNLVSSSSSSSSSDRTINERRRTFASTATTQPVQYTGAGTHTEDVSQKISTADGALRTKYDAMPRSYPAHSQPVGGKEIDSQQAFRKRLLYRSKQRGWLEVDLLMGAYAEAHLSKLSDEELHEYERILNRETIDLYNYATGKEAPPAEIQGKVMKSIIAFVNSSPLGKADPRKYEDVKKTMSN